MPKIIIVTGGVGFVGSNLMKILLKKTKFRLISIDNYSSGSKKNQIKSPRVKYINSDTRNISKILNPYKKDINTGCTFFLQVSSARECKQSPLFRPFSLLSF